MKPEKWCWGCVSTIDSTCTILPRVGTLLEIHMLFQVWNSYTVSNRNICIWLFYKLNRALPSLFQNYTAPLPQSHWYVLQILTAIIFASDLWIQGVLGQNGSDFGSKTFIRGTFLAWGKPWMNVLDTESKASYPRGPWIYEFKVNVMAVPLPVSNHMV